MPRSQVCRRVQGWQPQPTVFPLCLAKGCSWGLPTSPTSPHVPQSLSHNEQGGATRPPPRPWSVRYPRGWCRACSCTCCMLVHACVAVSGKRSVSHGTVGRLMSLDASRPQPWPAAPRSPPHPSFTCGPGRRGPSSLPLPGWPPTQDRLRSLFWVWPGSREGGGKQAP